MLQYGAHVDMYMHAPTHPRPCLQGRVVHACMCACVLPRSSQRAFSGPHSAFTSPPHASGSPPCTVRQPRHQSPYIRAASMQALQHTCATHIAHCPRTPRWCHCVCVCMCVCVCVCVCVRVCLAGCCGAVNAGVRRGGARQPLLRLWRWGQGDMDARVCASALAFARRTTLCAPVCYERHCAWVVSHTVVVSIGIACVRAMPVPMPGPASGQVRACAVRCSGTTL